MPRFWLLFAAASFLAAMAIGYHQDQMAAQSVMAKKVSGAPQDFAENAALTWVRQVLQAVSLVLMGLVLVLQFRLTRKDKRREPETREPAQAPQSTPMGFQPILTQEEIAFDDSPDAPQVERTKGSLGRLCQLLINAIRPVKSQP